MMKKNKLILCDLDGTLFDTTKVNFYSYKEALNAINYDMDYDFFIKECYGKHYKEFLPKMGLNENEMEIVHKIKKNTHKEILDFFNKRELFELIIAAEDVENKKPNPEGFIKAMTYFNINPEDTLIFEDSDVGIEAAIKSKANIFKVEIF